MFSAGKFFTISFKFSIYAHIVSSFTAALQHLIFEAKRSFSLGYRVKKDFTQSLPGTLFETV